MTNKQNIIWGGIAFAIVGAIAASVDVYDDAGIPGALMIAPVSAVAFGLAGSAAIALRLLMMNWFAAILVVGVIGLTIYAIVGSIFFNSDKEPSQDQTDHKTMPTVLAAI